MVEPPEQVAIREQVERILQSDSFRTSQLLSRFLRFAVDRALAGDIDSLKETVLGGEVCGRVKFDPRYDSVVRTTASRMRAKLTEYYEAHPEDKIRIEFPKGSYVPQFGSPPAYAAVETVEAVPAVRRQFPSGTGTYAVVALALVLVMAGAAIGYTLAVRWANRSVAVPATRRFQLSYPKGTVPGPLTGNGIAHISPDGRKVAASLRDADAPRTSSGIWIHNLELGEWKRLTPPELVATTPFWSPDSQEVGFSTYRAIRRARVDGGGSQIIAEISSVFNSASWSENGQILFSSSPQNGLMLVPATGGIPVQVTRRDSPRESWHYAPQFLPGADEFLYTAVGSERLNSKTYVSSLSHPDQRTEILTAPSSVSYCAKGSYLVYQGPGALMAVRYDRKTRRTDGSAIVIAPSAASDVWRAHVDASVAWSDGTLLLRQGTGIQRRRLRLLDAQGRLQHSSQEEELYRFPALSPDGRSVAVGITDPRTGVESIWIFDETLHERRRFSRNSGSEYGPVWSPDGSHIAFIRGTDVFLGPVAGADEVRQLTRTASPKTTTGWTPDGKRILFTEYVNDAQQDVRSVAVDGGQVDVLTSAPGNETDGQVSPDGKYLLYYAEANGSRHIYVERYPIDPAHREPVQLSVSEGYDPHWSRNGAEVSYVVGNKTLTAVSLTDRITRVRYETPTWFHRGYGHSCHPRTGACVLSAPGEDPQLSGPLVVLNPPWPAVPGR